MRCTEARYNQALRTAANQTHLENKEERNQFHHSTSIPKSLHLHLSALTFTRRHRELKTSWDGSKTLFTSTWKSILFLLPFPKPDTLLAVTCVRKEANPPWKYVFQRGRLHKSCRDFVKLTLNLLWSKSLPVGYPCPRLDTAALAGFLADFTWNKYKNLFGSFKLKE